MKINWLTFLFFLVSINLFSQKDEFVTDLDTLYYNNGEKKIGLITISSGQKYVKKVKICKEKGYSKCQKYSPEQMDFEKVVFGFSAEDKKQAEKEGYELIPKVEAFFKDPNKPKKNKYKHYTLMYEGVNYNFYEKMVVFSYMSGSKMQTMKTKYTYYTCLAKKGEKKLLKCFRSDNYKFYRKEILEYFKPCKSKLNRVFSGMKLKDPFPYAIVDNCGNKFEESTVKTDLVSEQESDEIRKDPITARESKKKALEEKRAKVLKEREKRKDSIRKAREK